MPTTAYCGIDLAFAKRKTLPVAVCVRDGTRVRPLSLRSVPHLAPPRGAGNRATLDASTLVQFADDVLTYLRGVERRFDVAIAVVAIDAPRQPAPEGGRRACETAMDAAGWSCFTTPSSSQWAIIRRRVSAHLARGGSESTLPHANQLWMLVGFAVFERLQREFDCIEVFPSAIVRSFDSTVPHKTTADGFSRQLDILRKGMQVDDGQFSCSCRGPRHDQLDALLSAWVASAPTPVRVAFGDGQSDTIWTVRTSAFCDA
jgi:predicted nuclease with RNAse H fold